MIKVTDGPFDALSHYPLGANKNKDFQVNKTHVFWPIHQTLVSKTYINMMYENQKFFVLTQEHYTHQKKFGVFPNITTQLATNVNLAIVKSEGSWVNHTAPSPPPLGLNFTNVSITEIPGSAYQRIKGIYSWFKQANIGKLLNTQAKVDKQLEKLNNEDTPYGKETVAFKDQMQKDMDAFTSDVTADDYQNFAKRSLMCFHWDIGERPIEKEGDLEGWWLPLEHTIMGWKGLNNFAPGQKSLFAFGTVTLTVDPSGENLNVLFRGRQSFRADIEDIYMKNMKLYLAPPNNIEPPFKPEPPLMASGDQAHKVEQFLKNNPPSTYVAWAPHDKVLCPKSKSKSESFDKFLGACENSWLREKASPLCDPEMLKMYPCFNYFVRSSDINGNSLTGLAEFLASLHLMNEGSVDYVRKIAAETPWKSFERAIEVFG